VEPRNLREDLLGRMDGLRGELQGRMDSRFRWILGVQIASWLSLIGAMLTFLFRR
jgi:hypothetical protein